MLIVIMGGGVSGAYCAYYSVNAGCAPNQAPYTTPLGFSTFGTVTDASDASLASGSRVQYINALGNYVTGPQADGSVGAGEVLVQLYYVGDDADKYNSFSSLDGKFYHGITGQSSINYYYVRAWDGDPSLSGSKFGESQIFTAATAADTPPVPNEVALSSFKVMFSKAAPDTPAGLGVSPISYTTATANFNASVGARYYEISWGLASSAEGSGPAYSYNTQRFPSPNSTDAKTIGMSGMSDDTDYWVKVRAVNSFGTSGWSSSYHFKTTRLPDNTAPQVITDLRIRDSGGSSGTYTVTMEWTAPYDTDRLGAHVNVSGYDIKYSSYPIIASTLEGFVDWYQATSIDPTYATPAPLNYGLTQEVTITGLSAGLKFFAVKSDDTEPNWSDMSNVTGTQLGMVGGYMGLTTIESGWSIIAAGQAEPMTLDNSNLYESGAQAGDQNTADVIYQYIPGTSNYNEAYLSLSGVWIDVNTGNPPTWEIEPDRGYFFKRRPVSPFTWGVRPKP
jgi:hypothetical protein